MKPNKIPPQVVGNIGLYYVCYQLSRQGWNVMPTSRNARGIDLLIYSQSARMTKTIQIKAQTRKLAVILGKHMRHLFADFVIVCSGLDSDSPVCYVMTPDEIKRDAKEATGTSGISYWLETVKYDLADYRERWDRIGSGRDETPSEAQELENP